ncbi:S1C family serine protease [Akkermansiaceae bacterium]|nr:S1C family serine protease [Akkermansiaceae bacterium]
MSCAFVSAQGEVNTLEEMKELQSKVKAVTNENMDVTVSILSSVGASGSGVIVSKDGLILTAAHVIDGADEVHIIFPDGKTANAKVLGANFSKDIAMCKMVDPGPWKFADIAPSGELEVGDFVVAMGHAYGFDPSRKPPVRFGRVLSKQTNYFVTTDCTLIGGDSGGPLYDLEGNVVAIHSNIGETWSTNNHGGTSGFLQDWDRLVKGERWGVLSIDPMTNPETPAIGIVMGRSMRGGVAIDSVLRDGPGDKAGIAPGDIIIKINENSVMYGRDIIKSILRYNAGDEITVTGMRNGEVYQTKLKLGKREMFKENN